MEHNDVLSHEVSTKLVGIAQSILGPAYSPVQLFKAIKLDSKEDDRETICFAAGVQNVWDIGTLCLLDRKQSKEQIVQLVSIADGFRELLVFDINQDGRTEIVSWWQAGSGAYLSLYIFQWEGDTARALFPDLVYHQGLVEFKDVDGDGIDEIVIWESDWDVETAQWEPQRYFVRIYKYEQSKYCELSSELTERRYNPSSIVSRQVSIMGTNPNASHRLKPQDAYKQELDQLIVHNDVDVECLAKLAEHQSVLWQEGFYHDSIAAADLVIRAEVYVPDSGVKAALMTTSWRERGVAWTMLGGYRRALDCYQSALESWSDDASEYLPSYFHVGLFREYGMIHSALGNYRDGLAFLSHAKRYLEELAPGSEETKEEKSRLSSNVGLTLLRLGDYEPAIKELECAANLDLELGTVTGRAINQMLLGNTHRAAGRSNDAIKSYEDALTTLGEVSDRDRESDVYLELGSTHISEGRCAEGLKFVSKALLFTSSGNLRQREAIHYIHLGNGQLALSDFVASRRSFEKALEFATAFYLPETKWQAYFGLARVAWQLGDMRLWQESLDASISTIEEIRSQYLPENVKISLLAERAKPYVEMVTRCFRGDPLLAFQYAERVKSRVFVERLACTDLPASPGISIDLLNEEARLIDHLQNLEADRLESVKEVESTERDLGEIWKKISAAGRDGDEYVALRKGDPCDFSSARELLSSP